MRTETKTSLKTKVWLPTGLVFLCLAAVWQFGLSSRWTRRVPPGWSWQASYIGIMSNVDAATGKLPDKDVTGKYEHSQRVMTDADEPRIVVLEDRYSIRDVITGQTVYQYDYHAPVDAETGMHVQEQFRGDRFLFPRNVQKEIYTLRFSYLKGIPVTFQKVEQVQGLTTYLFSYKGRGEYTEAYAGTAEYPAVEVKPGQEIRCADDQFVFSVWVEPLTGEILKVEENCYSGDYVYEIATGRPVRVVSRWGGNTAGNDVLERVRTIQRERRKLLWAGCYLPSGLAIVGILCLGSGFLTRRSGPI